VSSRASFVAFDLETTGLVPGVDRIVELAGVLFEGDDVLESWSTLVDPGIPIPPDAASVNGITDDMLRGQPRIESVLPRFADFLRRGIPVAHNACFDVGFLAAALRDAGVEPPPGPVLDTRALARRAYPGRFSYSLENLARDLSLQPGSHAHRALADADTCRMLFVACMAALAGTAELAAPELARISGPLDFTGNAPPQVEVATLLERARVEGSEVEIEYRSGMGETTRRRIRPLSFTRTGTSIAIVAWCYLRKAERTFNLDSISSVRPAP
jgi:DNA polymerase III epsilon subunit family exonuclease